MGTIRSKSVALDAQMRWFDVSDVTLQSVNSGECQKAIQKVYELCFDLVQCIKDFIADHEQDMSPEKVLSFRYQISLALKSTKKYQKDL